MFLLRFANLIRGYILISIEGFFLERFINICMNRNILLWDIKRLGTTKMIACISIAGFKKIATIAYKSRCRVKILKRAGLPFLFFKHRKRTAFAAGVFLFFFLIFVMSCFVWGVEISGLKNLDEKTVRQALIENGLKIGMPTGAVDVDAVRSRMMTAMPEVAWIGVNIVGSKAKVEIKERTQKPSIVEKDKLYNIKAKYDGVIIKIDVTEGQKLVKPGDVVTKGQLLVSGVIDSIVLGVRYVPSSAKIIAKTWHEASAEMLPFVEVENRTGNAKSKHILKVFGFNINFFLHDGIPYVKYDRISHVNQFAITPNLLLPFSFHYDKFYETEVIRQEVTPEQAYNNTVDKLYKQLDAELAQDAQVVNRLVSQKTDENGKTLVTATYECQESIVEMEETVYEPNGKNP